MQYWIFQAQIENGSLNNSSLFINLSVIYPLAIIAEGTVLKILDNDQFIFLSHMFILTYLPYWEAQYSLLVGSDPRVALTLLLISPVTQSTHQCPMGIDWAPWFLMIYLSPHKGASSTSDMLAQHHFSSQNGTATRAGPNITLDVRDFGLRIIWIIRLSDCFCITASLYLPGKFSWKGWQSLVGWSKEGTDPEEQPP